MKFANGPLFLPIEGYDKFMSWLTMGWRHWATMGENAFIFPIHRARPVGVTPADKEESEERQSTAFFCYRLDVNASRGNSHPLLNGLKGGLFNFSFRFKRPEASRLHVIIIHVSTPEKGGGKVPCMLLHFTLSHFQTRLKMFTLFYFIFQPCEGLI